MEDKIVELENGLRQVTTYYGDGKTPRRVCTFDKDGIQQGLFEKYYDNGQLNVKCTYKDDEQDGLYERYDWNGELIEKCIYKNGEVVEDKLTPDRKGLNKLLQSLDKNRKPTTERRTTKRMIVEEYRREHPKNSGR